MAEEQVLVLSCQDQHLVLSVVYDFIKHIDQENTYEKRLLYFTPENKKREDLHIDILANEKIGKGEKVICVVQVESFAFLKSLFVDKSGMANINHKLKKKNILVLCLISSALNKKFELQLAEKKIEFTHISLPFLESVLVHYLPQDSDISGLTRQLKQQQKQGLWGKPTSGLDFYNHIIPFLSPDASQLIKEVEKRKDVQGYQQTKEAEVQQLLSDISQLRKIVLFVATFFPDLRPSDVKLIVNLLAKDQTLIKNEEVIATDEEGNQKVIQKKTEVLLVDEWAREADKIIEQSALTTIREGNGSKVMEFVHPALRDALKDYFGQKLSVFCIDQYETLLKSNVLFNDAISEKISQNIIQLFVDMAIDYPETFGSRLLFSITQSIFGYSIDWGDLEHIDNEETIQVLRKINEIAKEKAEMFNRLADLLKEMLLYPQLQRVISDYLEMLCTNNLNKILFIVIRNLRLSLNLNDLEWIYKFLKRDNDGLAQETFHYLHENILEKPTELYDILDAIKSEWPPTTLQQNRYSIKHCYTVIFFLQLAESSIDQLSMEDYGVWPSKYAIFSALGEDKTVLRERMHLMLSMLFNPLLDAQIYGIFYNLNDNDSEEESGDTAAGALTLLQGHLTQAWFAVLYGIDGKAPEKEQTEIVNIYVEELCHNTSPEVRQQLIRVWEYYASVYQDATRYLPGLTREGFRYFRNYQKTVNKLIRMFRDVIRKSRKK
jgi:hypothetical protein